MTTLPAPGHVTVVGRAANGQPRTYRLSRPAARESAYRRLAAAILGLDITTLAVELRMARLSIQQPPGRSAHKPVFAQDVFGRVR